MEDVDDETTAAEMDLIARELVAEPVRIEVGVIDPRRLPELEDKVAECGISKVEIGNVDDTVIAFMDSFERPALKGEELKGIPEAEIARERNMRELTVFIVKVGERR